MNFNIFLMLKNCIFFYTCVCIFNFIPIVLFHPYLFLSIFAPKYCEGNSVIVHSVFLNSLGELRFIAGACTTSHVLPCFLELNPSDKSPRLFLFVSGSEQSRLLAFHFVLNYCPIVYVFGYNVFS